MAKKRKKVRAEPKMVVHKHLSPLPKVAPKNVVKWDTVLLISLVMLVMIPVLVFVIVASNIDSRLEIQIMVAFGLLRELYIIIAVWFLAIILYLEWIRSK